MCDSRYSDVLGDVNDGGWADSEGRSISLAPCWSVCSFPSVRFQDTAEHVSLSAVHGFAVGELMMQRCRSVWMSDEPQHRRGLSPRGSLLLPAAARRRAAPGIAWALALAASRSWSRAAAVFTGVFTHSIPAVLPQASPVGLAAAPHIPARRQTQGQPRRHTSAVGCPAHQPFPHFSTILKRCI